jgi:hypothetical protein
MKKADLYEQYWNEFFSLSESKIAIHSNAKPTDRGSVCLGYRKGLSFWYRIKNTQIDIALYISLRDKLENKKIFKELQNHQAEIEEKFGGKFVWEELPDKTDCRIYYATEVGELEYKKDKWKEIQVKTIDTMIRFQKCLSPYLVKFS